VDRRRRALVLGLLAVVVSGCWRDAHERLRGTWERTDNPGQTIHFDATRMSHSYPHGGKPIEGPYEVVDRHGDGLVIEPSIEFPDGRTLRADRQRIDFVDDDTLTMTNAKNGTGGTYQRRS
jgi:hypothetical protein